MRATWITLCACSASGGCWAVRDYALSLDTRATPSFARGHAAGERHETEAAYHNPERPGQYIIVEISKWLVPPQDDGESTKKCWNENINS